MCVYIYICLHICVCIYTYVFVCVCLCIYYVYTDTQTILCTYKTSNLYAYIKPIVIMPEKPEAISHGQEKNRGPAHPRALPSPGLAHPRRSARGREPPSPGAGPCDARLPLRLNTGRPPALRGQWGLRTRSSLSPAPPRPPAPCRRVYSTTPRGRAAPRAASRGSCARSAPRPAALLGPGGSSSFFGLVLRGFFFFFLLFVCLFSARLAVKWLIIF